VARGGVPAAAVVGVLALQGVALLGIAGFLAVRATGHGVTTTAGAVVAALLALLGGLAFAALARSLRPPAADWAAPPAIVLELLCLPVATGLVQSGRPELGLPLGAAALIALVGLLTVAGER